MNWSDNNGPEGLGTLPGELESTLIDKARLPSFHIFYPNLYFEFSLPGSRLRLKKKT